MYTCIINDGNFAEYCTSIFMDNWCSAFYQPPANVVYDMEKGSFYIAQYPVRWTAQSALHFLPPLADLFIPTPIRVLREAF